MNSDAEIKQFLMKPKLLMKTDLLDIIKNKVKPHPHLNGYSKMKKDELIFEALLFLTILV